MIIFVFSSTKLLLNRIEFTFILMSPPPCPELKPSYVHGSADDNDCKIGIYSLLMIVEVNSECYYVLIFFIDYRAVAI